MYISHTFFTENSKNPFLQILPNSPMTAFMDSILLNGFVLLFFVNALDDTIASSHFMSILRKSSVSVSFLDFLAFPDFIFHFLVTTSLLVVFCCRRRTHSLVYQVVIRDQYIY